MSAAVEIQDRGLGVSSETAGTALMPYRLHRLFTSGIDTKWDDVFVVSVNAFEY
jgi:hypothetical protein